MRKGLLSALLFLFCVLMTIACGSLSYRMEPEGVKDIILWQNGPDSKQITLNREEISAFLEVYNRATYRGRGDGSGGTAEWGAMVVKQDGMEIRILEFSGGPDFEVSCKPLGWWFYLDSEALRTFILGRLEG